MAKVRNNEGRKHRIYMRDRGTCHYCKRFCSPFPNSGRDDGDATLDHLQLRAEGGTNSDDNLVLACLRCNNDRSAIPYEIFVSMRLWAKPDECRKFRRQFSIDIQLRIEANRC